jgi:DNA-binding NarL/FixJ family response regulator
MIKLLIADDHRLFRESLRNIITIKEIADVLDEAENGEELLALLKLHKPDIILMDIAMPKLNGVEATKKILKEYPDIKVIALSGFDDEKYYFSMVEAGAKGFVLKNSGIAELKNAIDEVFKGNNWFSPVLLEKVIATLHSKSKKHIADLSSREIEILSYICESMTNEQIAEKIHLSPDTVKWHRSNLMVKTGCGNTAGLVMFAIKNKLIEF